MGLPDDRVILMKPSEHGGLHGQIVADRRVVGHAGEGGVGVRNIAASVLELDGAASGEQETPRDLRRNTFEDLDEPFLDQRAKQLIGRFGPHVQACGEEFERGPAKLQEPVQDEQDFFFSDGMGIVGCWITVFNMHGRTSCSMMFTACGQAVMTRSCCWGGFSGPCAKPGPVSTSASI